MNMYKSLPTSIFLVLLFTISYSAHSQTITWETPLPNEIFVENTGKVNANGQSYNISDLEPFFNKLGDEKIIDLFNKYHKLGNRSGVISYMFGGIFWVSFSSSLGVIGQHSGRGGYYALTGAGSMVSYYIISGIFSARQKTLIKKLVIAYNLEMKKRISTSPSTN